MCNCWNKKKEKDLKDLSLYSQNTNFRVCGTGWVQVERTHCAAHAHEWNGVITWNGLSAGVDSLTWNGLIGWNGVDSSVWNGLD